MSLTDDEREALHGWLRVEGNTTWLEAETVYAAVERIKATAREAAIREAAEAIKDANPDEYDASLRHAARVVLGLLEGGAGDAD